MDDTEKAIIATGSIAAVMFGIGGLALVFVPHEYFYASALLWGAASFIGIGAFVMTAIASL
jgi:hypothetical protein